ncbi:aspartate-semialdehyde dehydrogenase [mine drainage metagenome]|uniref:Aspartate-semialdehyde dehydrogenase n=3 Tax=mine drainage metagenome TaxID=410659 RepID=T1CLK8_9ZZZZ
MSVDRIPVAVLGAAGYIGQEFVRRLADHPRFDLQVLGGTARRRGSRLEDLWHHTDPPPEGLATRPLEALGPAALQRRGIRAVFSALPSGTAGPIENELARRGLAVFTNAADHRMDPDVPLLIPEVNSDHLRLADRRPEGRGLLVANANCSTTGLVLALAPVRELLAPTTVQVTTYQALSGAGVPGVPSLTITDNVVPFIPGEEEKIERETARIFGRLRGGRIAPWPGRVLPQCARVATRDGHLLAVTVEATGRPTLSELERAWIEFDPLGGEGLPTAPSPPILLRREADRPQPLRDRWAGAPQRARGMAAVVGRIRWEPPYLRFFTLTHNAVRGGAGGSVLNAELADHRGIELTARGRHG